MAWATLDRARDLWADADQIDDDLLQFWLEAVKPSIIDYAPKLPDDATPPANWELAQVMQARNAFNSIKAGQGGFDGSEYGITAHPLDWQVKQLLRPRVGRPRVR